MGDDRGWHFDTKGWWANQVSGQIVEAERRGFGGRIREILSGKERTSAWDQAAVAKERNDCARMGQSLWMEFMGVRNDSVRLVQSLKPGDLGKGIEHPQPPPPTPPPPSHQPTHHHPTHTPHLPHTPQHPPPPPPP